MKGLAMEKFKPRETILTKRIVLIKREHEHDKEMFDAIEESREFIREYLFWVDGTKTIDDVVKTTDMFYQKWEEDDEWAYDIYSLDDHKLIGCIGAHCISFSNQSAELGYWLRLSETSKGYMTEAILALEKELFECGLHRLIIRCDINNLNSSNVAKRSGYKLESVAKEAIYHYTGLHDCETYVKFSPYPIKGF